MANCSKDSELLSHYSHYIIRQIAIHQEDGRSSKQALWDNLAQALGYHKSEGNTECQRECKRLEENDLQAHAISRLAAKTLKLTKAGSLINNSKKSQIANSLRTSKTVTESSVHWWAVEAECKNTVCGGRIIKCENEIQNLQNNNKRLQEVTICVLDDARKSQEVFVCPRPMLLREMPYFEKFLESEADEVEVQFSVHCDVQVFKRLLLYASKEMDDKHSFKIEPKYAIHMLVSAEFLQMEKLVDECLKYCHENMNLLLSMSGIIGLLSENLLEKLASLFNHQDIQSLEDSADKIRSKIYRKKAEKLLNSQSPKLLKCAICNKIFTEEMEDFECCLPNRSSIGPTGEIVFEHKLDPTWDRSSFLQSLYVQLTSWARVYWRLWGSLYCLACTVCGERFSCAQLFRCRYHPEQVQFPSVQEDGPGVNTHLAGKFPCCGQKSFRFNLLDPLHLKDGCSYRMHAVTSSLKQSEVYTTVMLYKDQVCLPSDGSLIPRNSTPDYNTLCGWGQEKISRVTQKASTIPVAPQRPLRDDSRDINRLLQGRGELPIAFSSSTERMSQEWLLWNPSSSVWHNQDAVRDYDNRALDAIITQLKQL